MVLSSIAYSLSASAAKYWKIFSQIPDLAQWLKRRCTFFQSPKRSGRSRQGMAGAIAIQHRLEEQAVVRRGHADQALPHRSVPIGRRAVRSGASVSLQS